MRDWSEADAQAVEVMEGILAARMPNPVDCLIWEGKADKDGYGRIWVGGRSGRNYPVHRLAMCVKEAYPYAEIDGWLVRHQCHNRLCYNPEHLLLGDDKANVLDKVFAGRTGAARGERNARTRLTDEQVADIRALHDRGWKNAALAREYGVSEMHISRIVRYLQRT